MALVAFREALKKDPKGTVQKELAALKGGEVKLPDNLRVEVIEESADVMVLVLPDNPTETHSTLTDEQLMAVTGGANPDVNFDWKLNIFNDEQRLKQV